MHETLLLFGATGDLTQRYLFTSLANLLRDRLLPANFHVVAIARHAHSTESFRSSLAAAMAAKAGIDTQAPEIAELLSRTEYIAAELADPAHIAEHLRHLAGKPVVSFLATPPNLFVPISQGLKAAGLLDAPRVSCWKSPSGATWPARARPSRPSSSA
jgi:glucose-6-phosphate 1-dehydrogenase